MIEFLSLSKEAFGLEITDAFVRMIELSRHKGKLAVTSASLVPLDPGVVKDGDIKDEDRLVAAIKEAAAKPAGQNFKTRRVVVSLPEQKAFLQVVKMPELRGHDLKAAVIFEAENHIPLPLEKVYLDYQLVDASHSGSNSEGCEVLIAAFPREPIDARLKAITKAGLVPVAMELESQAILRAVSGGEKIKGAVVMIQIGDEKTNLIVHSGNSIRFTFSIPISNRYFLETIAKEAGVGIDEANNLKIRCGIEEFMRTDGQVTKKNGVPVPSSSGGDRRKIFEALIPGLVDFIQQVKKYIQYYQSYDNGSAAGGEAPEKIVMCGSGADLKGMDEFIALKLNIPVEWPGQLVDAKLIYEKAEDVLARQTYYGFCVAMGLAVRGLEMDTKEEQKPEARITPRLKAKKRFRTRLKIR